MSGIFHNADFEGHVAWKTLERVLGDECLLPSQYLAEPESQELHTARALAGAILVQALSDLERVWNQKQGLCGTRGDCAFDAESEVTDWFFEPTHFVTEEINGQPAIPETETQDFPTPIMPQRLTLEVDSDGVYSFQGCCALLSLDKWGIRRKIRQWISERESSATTALVSDGTAVTARRRAKERRE